MAYRLVSLKQPAAASATPADAEYQRGFTAAIARISAVMDSPAAKANPFAAAFMLINSTAAADAIIAWLPKMAPVAAPAKAGEDPLKLWGDVQGGGSAAAGGNPWATVQSAH